MKVLLDTHIYLWWLLDAKVLSASAKHLIATCSAAYISTVSIWEAGIKWQKGKLSVSPQDLANGIRQSNFLELPLKVSHAVRASQLPPHHSDPFDRMLVAQSVAEPLYLLTSDKQLPSYSALVMLV